MNNVLANLSVEKLMKAVKLRERMDALVAEFNELVGTEIPAPFGDEPKKRKGMSAAGRAKIAAAQKARWAKSKGTKAAPKKRRKMNAAARAKISAAAKLRWSKVKAAGKKRL